MNNRRLAIIFIFLLLLSADCFVLIDIFNLMSIASTITFFIGLGLFLGLLFLNNIIIKFLYKKFKN